MNNKTPGYDEWNKKHENASATYNPSLDAIFIRDKPWSYLITLKILQHEYGHHLWHKVLSEEEKERYNNLYASSRKFVSVYSLSNSHEDFAEMYAYYKLEANNLPWHREAVMESLEKKYPDF